MVKSVNRRGAVLLYYTIAEADILQREQPRPCGHFLTSGRASGIMETAALLRNHNTFPRRRRRRRKTDPPRASPRPIPMLTMRAGTGGTSCSEMLRSVDNVGYWRPLCGRFLFRIFIVVGIFTSLACFLSQTEEVFGFYLNWLETAEIWELGEFVSYIYISQI